MQISRHPHVLLGLILIFPLAEASGQAANAIPVIISPTFAPAPAPAPAISEPVTDPFAPPSLAPPPSPSAVEPFGTAPPAAIPYATAFSPNPAHALSIEALQILGLEAHGLIRAAQSQVDVAEASVVSAAAYPNPQVIVAGGPQHVRVPAGNPANYHRQVTVAQTIENPFVRNARIGSAEAGVEASRAGFDQVRADLAAQLRVRAYELLLRQEIARMEGGVLDLMEEVRRRIKVGVDVGETARFELIRADAEVLNAASRKEAAELNAQRGRVALMQFTAGALKPDFAVNASLFDPVNLPPLEKLRQEVPAVNPDVLRLQAELERARLRIKQERASVLPSVQVIYSNFQEFQYTSNLIGLNVTIPVFYRRKGEISAAVAESERVRQTLEYRRFEIGQLLESAWQGLQIAQRRVEMFEGGIIKEAESALQVAQAAYRFGERPLIDVLDTQRVLRGILADSLQARFDLQAAAAEIDRLRAYYPKEQSPE